MSSVSDPGGKSPVREVAPRRLSDGADALTAARAGLSIVVPLYNEGAGLERLFFELTTSGASTPSTQSDSIHPELAGAPA